MKICRGKGNHRTFTAKITAKGRAHCFPCMFSVVCLYTKQTWFLAKT